MKTRTKRILAVAALVVAAGVAKLVWDQDQATVIANAQEAAFDRTLAEARSQFPVGTPREVVLAGLRTKFADVIDESSVSTRVPLGRRTSVDWFCNFWQTDLMFTFTPSGGKPEEERLVRIEKRAIGECL